MDPQASPRTQTKKQLSLVRATIVVVVLLVCAYATTRSFERLQMTVLSADYQPWFAGYVDVTSVPAYTFEKKGATPSTGAVLSFIVSAASDPCMPTWGGYYTMDEAAVSLDLDRRIARFQQQGGKIAVSFGGARNSELALHCVDHDALYAAYRSVIERYKINTIDIDLENQGLSDTDASKRRAEVIARLQSDFRESDKNLAVWLTLPVSPQGLTEQGTDVIMQMLVSGVDVAGVNLMTMDYGESRDAKDTMFSASKRAMIESHRQLQIVYKLAGINLSSVSVWKKIGATPMIGQNDVVSEIFSIDDAHALNQFAREQGVGRMSMWSANRDIPCGENYVDVKVVSDLCSGVTSPTFAFAEALGNGFDGDFVQNASMFTVEDSESNVHVTDDPSTSPYQIWHETGVYLKNTKVVWHGHVYEAKWWTKNELPDNPVLQAWETPWQLIGPVLPGEKPVKQLTLPAGTYPVWSGQTIYDDGDRVLFNKIPYQAKWWNQGESPAAAAANPDSSPWVPLTQEQIDKIVRTRSR